MLNHFGLRVGHYYFTNHLKIVKAG